MNVKYAPAWVLVLVLIGGGGFGLGSGWVRFGPPGRDQGREAPGRDRAVDQTRPDVPPPAPLDDQVIPTRAAVSPAATPKAAPTTATAAPTTATATSGGVEIHEADHDDPKPATGAAPEYVTVVDRSGQMPAVVRSRTFAVVVPSKTKGVSLGGQALKADATGTRFAVDETVAIGSGKLDLLVDGDPSGFVVVPGTSAPAAPLVTDYANTKDVDFQPLPANDKPVTAFGNYLQLRGQDAPILTQNQLTAVYFESDGTNWVRKDLFNVPIVAVPNTAYWVSEFYGPEYPLDATGRLFLVAPTAGVDALSRFSKPVIVQRSKITIAPGQVPALTAVHVPGTDPKTQAPKPRLIAEVNDPSRGPTYHVNSTALTFSGTGGSPGAYVLVYLDDQKTVLARTGPLTDASGQWTAAVDLNTIDPTTLETLRLNRPHPIQVGLAEGAQPKVFSKVAILFYNDKGPSIDAVQATESPDAGLGQQAVVVRFKGNPLDPETIKATNFQLQPTSGTGTFDPVLASAVAANGVKANAPDSNSVTLYFNALKPDVYQLVVQVPSPKSTEGLMDRFGNPVQPPLVMTVTKGLGPTAVDANGIPRPEKAPNVAYPEFNIPRAPTNGFNPSDHVDSKVCRLYYYRDARRVAEIINRDLKSYNQAAVDTRRRLANKARDEADSLTDERRSQEVKAVRAAQASREAQKRLDQAQADQAKAKTARATAIAQISAVDSRTQILNQTPNPATPDPKAAAELTDLGDQRQQLVNQQTQAEQDAAAAAAAVQAAQADLQSARAAEAQSSDQSLQDSQKEDRARENTFRLEVAAAQEDPNSYAPGDPSSIDPVLQVSVSVIGEGLIQLRGPIKGINIIRRMINDIDTPAGQVRIAMHTVQINGEKEKRMERVAARIQAYVDHARFLTVQSAQMLRNAIVEVASEKAEQACLESPAAPNMTPQENAATQEARDLKYQKAFFGEDFILELRDIDAEFLHTCNKLLSLHSMDTTSLASALFLLALAKNDVRMEILDRFEAKTQTDLPQAEANFELSANRTDLGHHKEVLPLALNTRFESLRGFFNVRLNGADTLNPLQREFIKLAQILKSRLVTELEYSQRFKERGLIEDRLGDYLEELRQQKERETKARQFQLKSQEELRRQQVRVFPLLTSLGSLLQSDMEIFRTVVADFDATKDVFSSIIGSQAPEKLDAVVVEQLDAAGRSVYRPGDYRPSFSVPRDPHANSGINAQKVADEVHRIDLVRKAIEALAQAPGAEGDVTFEYKIGGVLRKFRFARDENGTVTAVDDGTGTPQENLKELIRQFHGWFYNAASFRRLVQQFNPPSDLVELAGRGSDLLEHLLKDAKENPDLLTRHQIFEYAKVLTYYLAVFDSIQQFLASTRQKTEEISSGLSEATGTNQGYVKKAFLSWQKLQQVILGRFRDRYLENAARPISEIDNAFNALIEADTNFRIAALQATESRRPIDTKKLLDMLIAEIEDKYIELLEGTRAHTANIDGYVKAIATALDDDFNTQFYYPAFRQIRQSSSFWDVELAQIETTNILTNNRMFAKVEPQATMEFDLPKRDILINEAMNGAKALMDTYGALVTDPSFLALAKLQSGQPTSSPVAGFGAGANTVRNVLPGLPRSNDEQLLSQAPAGRREFGSPLEALIPDPAIYKFETGTGFEIRPVIQPDGQAVVFHLDYMYTTNVREPVRADEKHLGRVKRHFIDTEVQLGNYELREVSRYTVALKASRTGQGVPLFQDIPGLGILFRPLPSASSSLQQNIILSQATIFPTLFDLIGLRIAPSIADLDTLRLRNAEFIVRGRARDVSNRVFDYSTSSVDGFLRVPPAERRPDLYRTQETIPHVHPDGYQGPGLNQIDSPLQEGYDPTQANPPTRYAPSSSDDANPVPSLPGSADARQPPLDPASRRASATCVPPIELAPRDDAAPQAAEVRAAPARAAGTTRSAGPRSVSPPRPGARPAGAPGVRGISPPRPTPPAAARTMSRTRALFSRLLGDD